MSSNVLRTASLGFRRDVCRSSSHSESNRDIFEAFCHLKAENNGHLVNEAEGSKELSDDSRLRLVLNRSSELI